MNPSGIHLPNLDQKSKTSHRYDIFLQFFYHLLEGERCTSVSNTLLTEVLAGFRYSRPHQCMISSSIVRAEVLIEPFLF